MYVDSHCHLDFPELSGDLPAVLQAMREAGVGHALAISVNLRDWPAVHALALAHEELHATVGVHPDYEDVDEPTVAELAALAAREKIVAIGETGLDYYRLTGDLEWQRRRFRTHIQAAVATAKPLVVHTRAAAADTIRLMREEHAERAGGVMHCFTEDWDVASAALDLGFHISISGIVTFRNAAIVKDVARRVPLDRLLIETDAPYLAPAPHRGKRNQPAYVAHVAAEIARLRDIPVESVAAATTDNFFRLFSIPRRGGDTAGGGA